VNKKVKTGPIMAALLGAEFVGFFNYIGIMKIWRLYVYLEAKMNVFLLLNLELVLIR
jgi:hypothetical protein